MKPLRSTMLTPTSTEGIGGRFKRTMDSAESTDDDEARKEGIGVEEIQEDTIFDE